MTMFKRILVPVDFSDKSQEAVDAACKLTPVNSGAEVILLHVIETIDRVDFDELRAFYEKLEKNASKGLQHLAEHARGLGVSVQMETIYGKRARSIIEFADKRRVDLIVLNSHRMETERGFPSISYEVGALASCPVLLLK